MEVNRLTYYSLSLGNMKQSNGGLEKSSLQILNIDTRCTCVVHYMLHYNTLASDTDKCLLKF